MIVSTGVSFHGLNTNDAGGFIEPPDPIAAAGPSVIIEEVNSNLTDQLQTRKVVERAKGILQRDLGLNEEQAYLALQKQSRQKRKAMREIAEAIILSEEVRENTRGAEVS